MQVGIGVSSKTIHDKFLLKITVKIKKFMQFEVNGSSKNQVG